jgi:thiol peroxidase
MELSGKPATIVGDDLAVGQPAPHFTSQVGFWPGRDLWSEVDPLAATAGSVRILTPVPSLDTSTCDAETRRFNAEAACLSPDIHVIAISADLPVALKRWCGAAGVDRVYAVSDHMNLEFGVKSGTLMKERRWLRRAVFVVDQHDIVRYAAYMPKLGDQPNYEDVLAIAQQLLAAGGGAKGEAR